MRLDDPPCTLTKFTSNYPNMGRVVHASKTHFLNSDRKWNSNEKTHYIFTIDFARY